MIKKITSKIKHKLQSRHANSRNYTLESKHPDNPSKIIPEHLLHSSVFEPNHPHDAPPQYSFEKAVFSWIAPEFYQHPKNTRWWTIFGIIAILSMIIEGFTGNWTMLIATVAFAVVYWILYEFYPPKHLKIVISEYGLKIGYRKIPYSQIERFCIFYHPPHLQQIVFRVKGAIFSDLIIELEEEDPIAIRNFLKKYLKEVEDPHEKITDSILRLLKL